MHVDSTAHAMSAEDVVAELACCPEITTMELSAPVKAAHMSVILAGLPLLTELSLPNCVQLESLTFFAEWAQRAALHKLAISFGNYARRRLAVGSLADLYTLRGLTSLTLRSAFVSEPDESTLRQLKPPSQLFPLLTAFSYSFQPRLRHQ